MSKILPMILAAGMSSGGGGEPVEKNKHISSIYTFYDTSIDPSSGFNFNDNLKQQFSEFVNYWYKNQQYEFGIQFSGKYKRCTPILYRNQSKLNGDGEVNFISTKPDEFKFYGIKVYSALSGTPSLTVDFNEPSQAVLTINGEWNENNIFTCTGGNTKYYQFPFLNVGFRYGKTAYTPTNDYHPATKKYVDDKVKEVEMFKFPNVTIIGDPTVNNGQISGFSDLNYLEFPFLVDFRGRSFEINFNITTGTDIDNQQNILDSDYGLAFAIKNKHLLIAVSTNGTSWAIAQEGTFILNPQTTYEIRISWNGLSYKVSYSTNGGTSYTDDITFGQSIAPYPKQMFIGVGKLDDNHFLGSINLNKANLKISDEIVWQGMDDVGLATRLATDLSNIDNAGVERIKDIAGGSSEVKGIHFTHTNGYSGKSMTHGYFMHNFKAESSQTFYNKLLEILKDVLTTTNDDPGNIIEEIIIESVEEDGSVGDIPCENIISGLYQLRTKGNQYMYLNTYNGNILFRYQFRVTWNENDEPSITSFSRRDAKILNLRTDNFDSYTPQYDYNPATKKYVDDAIGGALGGSY